MILLDWVKRQFARKPVRREVDVDVVVVGGGPYSLVRAIAECDAGKSVMIVDGAPVLGGAWAALPIYPDMDERFDVVAHLLSVYPDAYAMLEEAGFPLVERSIYFWDARPDAQTAFMLDRLGDETFTPITTGHGHVMAYHQYYALQHWPDGETTARQSAIANRPEFLGFRYMPHSFQPVVDRLCARFAASGGITETAQRVEQITAGETGITVSSGELLVKARKLISGRHLDCRIVVGDGEMIEEMATNVYQSLLVLARFDTPLPRRYVNVVGHQRVQAIQAARCESMTGEIVYSICLVVTSDMSGNPAAAAAELMAEMRNACVFEGAYEVLSARFHRHVSRSHSSRFLQEVALRCPEVELNVVDNLSACMANHRHGWALALSQENLAQAQGYLPGSAQAEQAVP
ncbi:MAG: NAD(P)-binding protein [Bosea sp. (in: a-proteobacteria)]